MSGMLRSLFSSRSDGGRHDPFWEDRLVRQCEQQTLLQDRGIETLVTDPGALNALMQRVILQWQALAAEPYWSNSNLPHYKLDKMSDEDLADYYREGDDQANQLLEAFTSRSGLDFLGQSCLELGAGSGRHTYALSQRYGRVIAIDIAGDLLRASAANLSRRGAHHVDFATLQRPDDLQAYRDLDAIFAIAVLPHNAPPIQRLLLEQLFAALRPGGLALFQFQDWIADYTFDTRAFLEEGRAANCDCHCLPKQAVFDVMRANAMTLIDFCPDFFAECFGSYTFLAKKDDAPQKRTTALK